MSLRGGKSVGVSVVVVNRVLGRGRVVQEFTGGVLDGTSVGAGGEEYERMCV